MADKRPKYVLYYLNIVYFHKKAFLLRNCETALKIYMIFPFTSYSPNHYFTRLIQLSLEVLILKYFRIINFSVPLFILLWQAFAFFDLHM